MIRSEDFSWASWGVNENGGSANRPDKIATGINACKRWQAMDGTVVDTRKIIHTEFRHFADALKFTLSLN